MTCWCTTQQRRAKLARKQARAARRLERQQKARARGITTDGVHYFMNFNDLHKWWDTRKSAAIKFKQLLYKHWFQQYVGYRNAHRVRSRPRFAC